MFCVFPKIIKPDVCEDIIKECKQNPLEEAGVYNYPNWKGQHTSNSSETEWVNNPIIRNTQINYIKKDETNKINKIVVNFFREANRIQFHYDLTYIQAVQFAEYKASNKGHYSWHKDDSGINQSNDVRKLSFGLALSNPDNFEGGEFQFYNGGRPMDDVGEITGKQVENDIKSQGTVIVFDSRDFHRVTPVTRGVRHSLVSWITGPNFK